MRIAYVTEWDPYAPSGVLQKIIAQVRTWKRLGHDAEVFSLSTTGDRPAACGFEDHGRVIARFSKRLLSRFPLARLGFFNKVLSAPELARAVSDYRPDLIYYRQQGPWYPGVGAVLAHAPVVMELNANAAEARCWGRINSAFRAATQARLWSNVDGFVSVSHEIADEIRPLDKPVSVVPNAMSGPPWRDVPPSRNKRPAFVFVGSPLSPHGDWHGIDKILRLARLLEDCHFHIVGLQADGTSRDAVPSNVQFHGPKFGSDLAAIYRASDVGIGTLALHRRGIETTSALKPLEYLMFGLPVVFGYRETDARLNAAEYALTIGNYDRNIEDNAQAIRQFANAWLGRRVVADLSYLSSETIEHSRLAFFAWVVLSRMASSEAHTSKPLFHESPRHA